MALLRPKIIMANGYPKSGVIWIVHQLCWLFNAQQGGPELRRNLKWKPDAKRRYEIHKGHYKSFEIPGYVDYLVLSIRNPLDVIVSRYFHKGGIGDIQSCVDTVCYSWASWYQSYEGYNDDMAHAKLIYTSYEGLIKYPRQHLREIYYEVVKEYPSIELVDQVIKENTLIKLRERTGDVEGKFFRKGIVGDYKNYLSEAQIAQVYSKLGDMMMEYGYDKN